MSAAPSACCRGLGLAALRLLAREHGLQVSQEDLEDVLQRAAAGQGLPAAPASAQPSGLPLQLDHACRRVARVPAGVAGPWLSGVHAAPVVAAVCRPPPAHAAPLALENARCRYIACADAACALCR